MGANLGTACEGALKFGETISIPSFAYETEEYIHDPNIQMTPAYSVFLIDGGEGTRRIHQNLSVWGAEQSGNVRQFIRYSSAGKGQRYKADCKRHIEEIKCPVR